MKQLIECVPNFSEGRDMQVIRQITDEIEKVEGVKLLDVDPGKATNRTVVTFVGDPDAVINAAFLAIKKASEIIDMSRHKGEHPRFGGTDVCPLVPISDISMEENWLKELEMNWKYLFIVTRMQLLSLKDVILRIVAQGNTKGCQKNWKILNGSLISVRQSSIPAQERSQSAHGISSWLIM
jgi:hypothetical protein